MTSEVTGDGPDVAGLGVDEAVETLVAADDSRDPDHVRSVLTDASEDGVVTEDAIDDAISHTAKVVATPETRVELAEMAVEDAREAADPVADIDVVATRLTAYEDRLASVQEQVDEVATDLESVVDGDTGGIYETALALREVTVAANEATEAADALKLDVAEFEHWLTSPDKRLSDVEADVTDVEESIEALEAQAESLEAVADDSETEQTEQDGGDWAAARIRHRTLQLLVDDIRAELSAIRTWHERQDIDHAENVSSLSERLDSLSTDLESVAERLESVGPAAWRDRFGDDLSAFDEEIVGVQPPVDWATVEEIVDAHRTAVESRMEPTDTSA